MEDLTGHGWDHRPKVQTAIKSLKTYDEDSSHSDQEHRSFASGISKDGFYVNGYTVIPEADNVIIDEDFPGLSVGITSDGDSWTETTSSTATYMSLDIVIEAVHELGKRYIDLEWGIYYRSNSSWIEHATESLYEWGVSGLAYIERSYVIPDLGAGEHEIKVEVLGPAFSTVDFEEIFVRRFADRSETIVDIGEVIWIAVEGGAGDP